MTDTYSRHADICTKFYELNLNAKSVAEFVFQHSKAAAGDRALFVGGMFSIAAELRSKGLELVAVDYTDEMVAAGKLRLPGVEIRKADLRELPFVAEFDLILVIGRVFTHMIEDGDLGRALKSCRRALRMGGSLFADNYEDSKIQRTKYFNGVLVCRDGETEIVRKSTTTLQSVDPHVVRWNASYSGRFNNANFSFNDSMQHRAFSRREFAGALAASGFEVSAQGDNFDETSFYTLGKLTRQAAVQARNKPGAI